MKKILTLFVISCSLIACENNSAPEKKADTPKEQAPMVGNDSDEHGCKASAGYTWSVIKNDCIRIWENGVQLSPVEKSDGQISNATIILNDDKTKAELFIVDEKGSVMLTQTDAASAHYEGGDYQLNASDKGWQLKKSDKLIYSEHLN